MVSDRPTPAESSLGRSIQRRRFAGRRVPKKDSDSTAFHTDSNRSASLSANADPTHWQRHGQSVTEMDALGDFLYTASLAETDFAAERVSSKTLVAAAAVPVANDVDQSAFLESFKNSEQGAMALCIPRRPKWKSTWTAAQLDAAERESFLQWRRSLAAVSEGNFATQEQIHFTPYERNLDIWRQLWRVVERCALLVQIVDARNPLLFYCEDLRRLIREADPSKRMLLLLNKADLLTPFQRECWARYLREREISFCFYSALEQQQPTPQEENLQEPGISSSAELFGLLQKSCPVLNCAGKSVRFTVGMIGYPNVGKSSTINSLLSDKRVAVGSTPGKTKHFQTHLLSVDSESQLMLCDCPGLVFPNVSASRAELVVNGVLPIDQARDYVGPAALVAMRIPKAFLQSFYAIPLPQDPENPDRPPTGAELLSAYALIKGFRTGVYGAPDQSRAARIVLRDYVAGKLRYCHAPPLLCPQDEEKFLKETAAGISNSAIDTRKLPKLTQGATVQSEALAPFACLEIEGEFFQSKAAGAGSGAFVMGGRRVPGMSISDIPIAIAASSRSAVPKPLSLRLEHSNKKHFKGRK